MKDLLVIAGVSIVACVFMFMVYDARADELQEHYEDEAAKPRQTFEEIVADTFDFEEYSKWISDRQRFDAKANQEREQQIQCVANSKNPKQCVDPHWCLYPSNERKDECILYNLKMGF